jgi:hypothetical protein
MKIFGYLELAVTAVNMVCIPGTGGNDIRHIVYLEPAVTVLDMLYTWNQR